MFAWDIILEIKVVCHAGKEGIQSMADLANSKVKDSSSKIIFGDPILCSQFLRGYVDIPLLKEVRPEDIEDVTNRYVHMFVEERNSDVVKKVHLKENEVPFYLLSLIEHKSKVDYNVVMQILRYMVYIWEDYEKEMERKQTGISKTKGFQYPPVLPIIFYDGFDNWTAATQLKDRIFLSDNLIEYIPDFNCILVQLKDYSNDELKKKKDELSIIMMINKLQEAAGFIDIGKDIDSNYLREATMNSPEYLLDIMAQIIEVLLLKLNVPMEEAADFSEQVKERRMGELFANFKAYDVQATRKEEREKERENGIEKLVLAIKEVVNSFETAQEQVMKQYGLNEADAKEKVNQYW